MALAELEQAGDAEQEHQAEMESQPSKVTIVATRVDGDIEDPAYILTCVTARDDLWPILRRWSAFQALHKSLLREDDPARAAVAFPDAELFGLGVGSALQNKLLGSLSASGGGGAEAAQPSATQRRKAMLEAWIKEMLKLCPAEQVLLEFLGDDNSITAAEARKLGIEVVSSARQATAEDDGDAVAEAEHRKRQQRHNSQVIAAMDAAPERVVVSLARPLAPSRPLTPATPAPAPAPKSSGWGSAFASFADKVSTSVAAASKELSEVASAAVSGADGWKGYTIQCVTADGQCWHVRRSLCEVIKLNKALLTDGNPALRGLAFPSKLTDAAVALRPAFVDDDPLDASERRRGCDDWLNQVLEACPGDTCTDLAAFLAREERVLEYTALQRCVLCEEPAAAADGGDAVEIDAVVKVGKWVIVEGAGEWAQEETSGRWFCAVGADGAVYVSADGKETVTESAEEKAAKAARQAQEDRFAKQAAAAAVREAESERMRQLAVEAQRLAESEAQQQLNKEDTDGADQTAGTRARAKARAEKKAKEEAEAAAAAAVAEPAAASESNAAAEAEAAAAVAAQKAEAEAASKAEAEAEKKKAEADAKSAEEAAAAEAEAVEEEAAAAKAAEEKAGAEAAAAAAAAEEEEVGAYVPGADGAAEGEDDDDDLLE